MNKIACSAYAILCFFYGVFCVAGGALGFWWTVYGVPPEVASDVTKEISALEMSWFLPLLSAGFVVFGIIEIAIGVFAWLRYISAMIVGCGIWILMFANSAIHGGRMDTFVVVNGAVFTALTIIAAITARAQRPIPQQAS